MKMEKKDTGNGGLPYARKEAYEYDGTQYDADIKNGDTITLKSAGEVEEGQYGAQFVMNIETRNGDKRMNVNQTSINVMIDAFGDESTDWVGKEVTVYTKKDIINNKKVIIAYLAPEGYILDEWGDLVKDEPDTPREVTPQEKTEGQKAVDAARAEGDELADEDIPF